MTDHRLVKFLEDKAVGKNEPFTHVSKIRPCRRININDDDLDDFYEIYNTVISEGGIAGIAEKPAEIVSLIVDIDFRCSLDNGLKRQYKPKHIRDIIGIYHEIIEEITENPDKSTFYCCVLEKSTPVSHQGTLKDGFHLHFPYFYTEAWVQKDIIRPEVIRRMTERKILSDIKMLEPLEKVFDANIPSVCWLMYGSRKQPSSEPYTMTKRYNNDMELIPLSTVFKGKFTHGTRQWNLPRYLSIRHEVEPTLLKDGIVKKKQVTRTKRRREFHRSLEDIYADMVVADQLLEMVSTDRADDYRQWMEVGWVLYNISEGHQKGLESWVTFSSKSEKFEEGGCEKRWDNMELRGYTLSALKQMARNDSPNEFKSWRDVQIDHVLHQGISMAHNDIAKILYLMFENQYICADIEKDVWYEFKTHRWERVAKGVTLRQHISQTLANKYMDLAQKYIQQFQDTDDVEQRQMYNSKAQLITKLVDKLKNSPFKSCVMREASEYFYDKHFIEKMDENPNLLVCENGVYDAEHQIFRDGRPDDFCTKTTGLYYQTFDDDDPRVLELEEIFKKTFVNPKLLKFFRQTSSDLIRGGNRHKIFSIWTGAGNNGKSICADLLERAFGEYYYTPPTTILTGKQQQSSGATAELLPCKGAKIVVTSETDNSDVLNCGTMKKLTGGDPFYARGLFKEPVKIVPHFKLILHCNKLPNVSAEDKASWNRIRVLPFESTFVKKHEAPKSAKTQLAKKQFPMDKSLKDRLDTLAEAFLWWLIKAFEEFGDADLYEPDEVKAATDSYRRINDFYMEFIDERIMETGCKNDKITLTLIYAMFKEWYKDSYPGQKISSRAQVKDSIEKKLGPSKKGTWYGYDIYDPDALADSDDENNQEVTETVEEN